MTGEWEKRLHDISIGKEDYHHFIKDMEQTVRSWYELIVHSNAGAYTPKQLLFPLCGAKAIKGKFGYFCSSKKDTGCRFSIPLEICGKPITDAQAIKLIQKGKTGIIKGFKSKKGTDFEAALKLDKTTGKIEFEYPSKKEKKKH